MVIKSPLKYIGMKDIDLLEYNINKYSVYCEPFGGSFNTGLRLIQDGYRGEVIYNDKDESVVNFWLQLKNNANDLIDGITTYKDKIKSFSDIKTLLDSDDDILRAVGEYFYRKNLTLKGVQKIISNRVSDDEIINLMLISVALTQVKITNTDWKTCLDNVNNKSTFALIDPPYVIDNVDKYYRETLLKDVHYELRNYIGLFRGNWLLTYNNNQEIKNLYRGFNIKEVKPLSFNNKYSELYITQR